LAFEAREANIEQRRRALEAELDEPGYIEVRGQRGGYGNY
jgi:hypothetical protein